ncbi:MAG: TIGR01777 family oxidoreductase [Anaerolineae bacterium]|nr:MAG: TIGR01777 family oxidoreductase [Anaerolineae bacterium]
MQIVITGGTGTIGRALTALLTSEGHDVVILSRNPKAHLNMEADGVAIKKWQVESLVGWGPLIDGADVVVNFAGENLAGDKFFPDRWNDTKKQRISESRIAAGQAVNQAIKKAQKKPAVLIQASAIGYYGPRGDEVVTETSEPGQDFLSNICVEWESTTAPVEELGVRRVIIRTGLILTTDSGPLAKLLVPFKLFAGGPFGSGKQWWSWIHLEDVVKAVRFLMENKSASGPINLTAPNPTTNREFSKELGRVMFRPSFVPLPAFVMKLAIGDAATLVLDGQRVIPQRLQQLGFSFSYPDLNLALRDLLD